MQVKSMSFDDMRLCRELYEANPIPEHGLADPYMYFDPRELSPIEFVLWCDIRCVGLYGFFAQYPIGKYFADFANPKLKIVIEADGKGFHQDWHKDEIRQREIEKMGWQVFRLTGSAIMRHPDLVFEQQYGEGYWSGDTWVSDHYEMPWEEREDHARMNRNDCGYLFCEWLRDVFYK